MTPFRRLLAGSFLLVGLAIPPVVAVGNRPENDPAPPASPRLAVLLIFDQMRGDYLIRWQDLFGQRGFRRLESEGAWYQNCHYPYAFTLTGPGHASVLAGCSPDKHGIILNDWYDRAAGEKVYCVGSERYERVPPMAVKSQSSGKKPRGGISPERLLVPTLGDALKNATEGRGRVVSLSFKDRSAVLPAGRHPDACYWLDSGTGTVVTSSYYRPGLPPWVEQFNAAKPADRWFSQTWQRLRPDLDYARFSGPDDVVGEGTGFSQGRTFPHPLTGGLKQPGGLYYNALYTSPFGNDLLLDLARRAIDSEGLGTGSAPDLLCISFSCNDSVGHCWGPDSQEVLDVTLRSDRIVAQLLDYLDVRVGKDRYILALTADHGVCPLPEVASSQGQEAGRIPATLISRDAEAFLEKTYGPAGQGRASWIEASEEPWIYLNQNLIRQRGLKSSAVEDRLAEWLVKQRGVLSAFTRTQLANGLSVDHPMIASVRRSFHPDRAGDVAVILKPYYLLGPRLTGTTHGTPHPYDTHVPLLVYGPGVRPGVRKDKASPLSVAAILADSLHIRPPAAAEAPVPVDLFER
jgi:Type I phosphodiesterase / nucleotide pyrophosphatase